MTTVADERLRGKVLARGGQWITTKRDGTLKVD